MKVYLEVQLKLWFHALFVVGILRRSTCCLVLGLTLGGLVGCGGSGDGSGRASGVGGSGAGEVGGAGSSNGAAGASGHSASNGGSEVGAAGEAGNDNGLAGSAGDIADAGSDGSSGGNGGRSAGGAGTAGSVGGNAGSSNVPVVYVIGGTVTGLPTGQSVVLQNNGANDLSVTKNGSFAFSSELVVGASFSVTVLAQPTGATCTVASGTGTSSPSSLTAVVVTCSAVTRTVGGTITGLGTQRNRCVAER